MSTRLKGISKQFEEIVTPINCDSPISMKEIENIQLYNTKSCYFEFDGNNGTFECDYIIGSGPYLDSEYASTAFNFSDSPIYIKYVAAFSLEKGEMSPYFRFSTGEYR